MGNDQLIFAQKQKINNESEGMATRKSSEKILNFFVKKMQLTPIAY